MREKLTCHPIFPTLATFPTFPTLAIFPILALFPTFLHLTDKFKVSH